MNIELLRRYIQLCKRVKPKITEDVKNLIVEAYVNIRKEARIDNEHVFTSPRTLLTIIRLSIASARLRLAHSVEIADVNEVLRLLDMSRQTVNCENVDIVTSRT